MTNLTNLFTDKIYSKLIDLTYKKSVIDSYNTVIKRDLYQDFYDDFKRLIVEIKKQKNYELYIDYIEKNNYLHNEFILFIENGDYYETQYQFLEKNNQVTLERLNLKTTPNYQELKIVYQNNIINNDSYKNLNDDFLKVFIVTYGKISFNTLTVLFLDIIIDFKEFDGIKYVEDLIFIDKINPNPFFYKKNGFLLYHKALTCYSYLNDTLDRDLILEKMYACMDEDYDTNNNPILHPNSTEEFPYYSFDGQEIGVVQKKDRISKENDSIKKIPKWSFSTLMQIENTYRLNLISKEIYDRKITLLKKNLIDGFSIISNFNFLKLSEDEKIDPQNNSKEYFHKPNTHYFDELDENQKSEYITAFSNDGNVHKIIKYGRFRIERLVKAYFDDINLKNNVILELQLIQKLTHLKREVDNEIDNINTHYLLKKSNTFDKIEKAIQIVSINLYEGIYVRFNNKYYGFHSDFNYSAAALLPIEIIELILIGGNITREEYKKWEYEYRNSEVSTKASLLNFKITYGEYTGLAANKKTDAPILISLLEKEYNDFIPFFKENLKITQYSHFIDPLISRLMSAYIALDEYEKAILLADEFIEIKNTYTELYLTPEAEKILNKREKCLSKMPYSYLPYEEATEFIKNLKLNNQEEWKSYKNSANRPQNIPTNPEDIYKNRGWNGFQDWLGYDANKLKHNFLSYEEAQQVVKEFKLTSEKEWKDFKSKGLKPDNIPALPENVYKDKGWKGFQDWLGYDANKLKHNFLSYEEAQQVVKEFKLTSEKEWKEFKNKGLKPENIPAIPERVYKDKGWKGFQDWLGYDANKLKYKFLPYEDARVFVHSLELESENQWIEFKRLGIKPENIPAKPENVYKGKGWKGYKDWLGY